MNAFLAKARPQAKSGWLELEKGAKFGGKFGKWTKLFFVIEDDGVLACYLNDLDAKPPKETPEFSCDIGECAIRFPKSERKGRPNVFRIDTTGLEKYMVDPGSPEAREAWIVELGNTGANVPGEWADKIDASKVSPRDHRPPVRPCAAAALTCPPASLQAAALAKRGERKGWMNMKTVLGWKPFWLVRPLYHFLHDRRRGELICWVRAGSNLTTRC